MIIEAAEVEFATRGYEGARTEAIADRAHVVKGLIFHYFKNKEKLYEAVLQKTFLPFAQLLEKPDDAHSSPREALLTFVASLMEVMAANPLGPSILLLESIQADGKNLRKLGMPSLYKRLDKMLSRGIKAGEFRELDTWHTAINVVGLCAFYFSSAGLFTQAKEEPADALKKKALRKHAEEVIGFVDAGVASSKKR